MKQSLQDATSVEAGDIANAKEEIETWVERAGKEGTVGGQEEEWEERGVAELCTGLCEVQVLIPLSSKLVLISAKSKKILSSTLTFTWNH